MSSTQKITKVAIAGASGSLGRPITTALVDAGFTVTALTRPDSKSTFPAGVTAVPVDYTSKSALQSVLTGQDALVSALTSQASSSQENLLEAAAAAGVRRLIPSEFGSDTSNARARALPVYKDKIAIQELVERLCAESQGKTTYTYVLNNAFLDWGVEKSFLIDWKGKTFDLIDGGNGHFTTTPLDMIAQGVVAILQKPEQTANKSIRIQGARLTQRQFLEITQRVVGAEGWTVNEVDSKVLEKQCYEVLKTDPSNVPGWVFGMLKLAVFAEEFGGDYGSEHDNGLLGLKEMSEKDVEEVVRGAIQGAK